MLSMMLGVHCLGETVTYPHLEGVSLYESVPMQLHVPSFFGGRAGSEVSLGQVFPPPRVCWQLSPWSEFGLEMEWLEPELRVRQSFSCAEL